MKNAHLWMVLLVAVVALPCAGAEAANRKGAKAPEITVSDGINGITKDTKLAQYKGSPVLLVYWLPVCPRCQKFMPSVQQYLTKYGPKGLKIVTICVGKKAYTQQYMRDRKYTFPVGFDYTGKTARAFGFKSTPGTALIGADGLLRYYTGTLEAAIQEELPK